MDPANLNLKSKGMRGRMGSQAAHLATCQQHMAIIDLFPARLPGSRPRCDACARTLYHKYVRAAPADRTVRRAAA